MLLFKILDSHKPLHEFCYVSIKLVNNFSFTLLFQTFLSLKPHTRSCNNDSKWLLLNMIKHTLSQFEKN